MDSHTKSSRFSTLNVFGKLSSNSKPPRPPPKDQWYRQGSKSTISLAPSHALSTHAASIASSSHETLQIPQTPISIASRSQCDLPRSMSPVSTRSRATTTNASSFMPRHSEASSFLSKLSSSFGKRPKAFLRSSASRTTLSPADPEGVSEDGILVGTSEEDVDISGPWGVQHHLHVDEGLTGLPPEWIDQLRASGFRDADILSTHSRRNRTTYLQHHPDIQVPPPPMPSPYSSSISSPTPSIFSSRPSESLRQDSVSSGRHVTSDDASSVFTTTHSISSGGKPTESPPSSNYDYASRLSPSSPSISVSVSSRSPSLVSPPPSVYTSDDTSGIPIAAKFTSLSRPPRPDRPLPRQASTYGDLSSLPSTPQSRTATFRVMNASPPSPPPAYGPPDPAHSNAQAYVDVKVNPNANSRREGNLDVHGERRSEDTVTPEASLANDEEDSRPLARYTQSQSNSALSTPLPPFTPTLPISSSGEPTSPPASPFPRTTVLPPRLSLHQDIDSDLSSWSEQLFSVMNTPEPTSTPASSSGSGAPSFSTHVRSPIKSSPTTPKKSPVPPLILSPPAEDTPRVVLEVGPDHSPGFSTPLFDEVMSLVQSSPPTNVSGLPTSTYPYLPSPPANSTAFPQSNYEFLSERYDTRPGSGSSQPSSRDSQATISASSRWSRATTVRDVRDATIVHARRPSVANAMTVPAPGRRVAEPGENTLRSDGSSVGGDRPLSTTSSDAGAFPLAEDFPMPPPSPVDGAFGAGSVQMSPMSATFSMKSVRASVDSATLSYDAASVPASIINRLPSPASTRSSQSSSCSGSTSASSRINPLSITSGSDEGPDEGDGAVRKASVVRVELQYAESESSFLSPTDSEAGVSKWGNAQAQKTHIDVTASVPSRLSYELDTGDGASAIVDWLTDTPSPHYDLHGSVKRDSVTVYNHRGESLLHPNAAADRASQIMRPSLKINGVVSSGADDGLDRRKFLSPSLAGEASPSSSSSGASSSTPSPLLRYNGWVSEVVAPLEEFIDHTVDPRELFTEMQEIAEGESGSVYVATVMPRPRKAGSTVPRSVRMREDTEGDTSKTVAIKSVPLLPGGSPKLEDLRKELLLMSHVRHENILSMDGLYVDIAEDSLWIKMELMERSLADMLALSEEGLTLPENVIARFTSDMLNALVHLEELGIAHRDVRSDNLLVNSRGVLKLADFSHALLIDSAYPMHTDAVGVFYWQAPEMRSGSYDARKVDVWSAGATAWEMAENEPPFMDVADPRLLPDLWPTLSQADSFSRSFHNFLSSCSSPPSSRPTANDLLTTSFIHSACARTLVVDLLAQCTAIEARMHRRQSGDSQGTVLS
ncbi:hypothetical protein M0805_007714 [Coniferiporia weirii]|nr:hypothetical protein M0805_007714 [Coniferiporia weirii]